MTDIIFCIDKSGSPIVSLLLVCFHDCVFHANDFILLEPEHVTVAFSHKGNV